MTERLTETELYNIKFKSENEPFELRPRDVAKLLIELAAKDAEIARLKGRVEGLICTLKFAREEITAMIKDSFYLIGKEYLAKEYVEKSSTLALINRDITADDQAGGRGDE